MPANCPADKDKEIANMDVATDDLTPTKQEKVLNFVAQKLADDMAQTTHQTDDLVVGSSDVDNSIEPINDNHDTINPSSNNVIYGVAETKNNPESATNPLVSTKSGKPPKVVAVKRSDEDSLKKTEPVKPKKSKKTPQKEPIALPLGLIASVVAGLAFVFSLAPYGLWVVAILSPMVLYALLLMTHSTKRAFYLGLAYGFGVWASGAFWLYTSISLYGGVPSWLALIMIGVMALVMGLFHGLMSACFVQFLGRQPIAFASIWVIQEWLKTWLLTGFPWLFVGYAFTEVKFVSVLAPIVGVLGISFVVVLFSASVVELLRQKAGYLLIAVVMLILSSILYVVDPTWTKPTGEKLSVSLVQGNIPQDVKWLTEYQQETLDIYAETSQHEWGRDMVIWPEGAVTVFHDQASHFLMDVDRFAKHYNTAFLTGIPYRDLQNFDPNRDPYPPFYNSVMALGAGSGIYNKQNLVPFGEYIPMGLDLLPNLANNHNIANHSKGDKYQKKINIKNKNLALAICYEVAYPETTRRNAKDSDFILTVSNDAWFGTSAGPHQHLQMVQMRALETGRWFVRGTNTGITAIIDHNGNIVAKAPQFVRTVLRGDVSMMMGRTPYMKWGLYPILVISFVFVGLSAIANVRGVYFRKDGKYTQDYR